MKKHSENNLRVINNFILHLMHSGDHGLDANFEKLQSFSPKDLYRVAQEYIEEDHVDGRGNPEDEIPTFGAESSFDHEDEKKEYDENLVVVADFGKAGTQTVATFSCPKDVDEFNEFLEFLKNPIPQ